MQTDYCRTLREWARRLDANFHGAVLDDLRARYPALRAEADLAAFKRKWHYMFVYAEVGYARAYTSLNCWTFARPVSGSGLVRRWRGADSVCVGECGRGVFVRGWSKNGHSSSPGAASPEDVISREIPYSHRRHE